MTTPLLREEHLQQKQHNEEKREEIPERQSPGTPQLGCLLFTTQVRRQVNAEALSKRTDL